MTKEGQKAISDFIKLMIKQAKKPGDAEPLLGRIPLEDMDVLIHPLRQELIVSIRPSILCANED